MAGRRPRRQHVARPQLLAVQVETNRLGSIAMIRSGRGPARIEPQEPAAAESDRVDGQ